MVCGGIATRTEQQSATAFNSFGQSATVTSNSRGEAAERIRLEIKDDGGRIRLPKYLLPPANTGGLGDGWWELKDVAVSDDSISGRFVINFLNKPKFVIDRTTGDIDVKGGFNTAFRGVCEKIDPEVQKKF